MTMIPTCRLHPYERMDNLEGRDDYIDLRCDLLKKALFNDLHFFRKDP